MKTLRNYTPYVCCTSCTMQMIGVYSDDIRTECAPCGGKSLIAEERAEQHERAGGLERWTEFRRDGKIKSKFSL